MENYSTCCVKAGAIGTLVRIGDGPNNNSYWLKMEDYVPELDEWNNELEIPDHSAENAGQFQGQCHPESFIETLVPAAMYVVVRGSGGNQIVTGPFVTSKAAMQWAWKQYNERTGRGGSYFVKQLRTPI